MAKYKWIIWFSKKWNRHRPRERPRVYRGYMKDEIFWVDNTGFQTIDDQFKKDFYYEFFDSKEDVDLVSKKLQIKHNKIETDFHDTMEKFYSNDVLKIMRNKVRQIKLDKLK